MARYIDAEKLYSKVKEETNPYGKPTLDYESGVKVLDMINNQPTADVVEIEKVAEILADITGIAPCEKVGNEWLFDCCEHIGYCCQASDSECWVQYFKHYKERSEGDG